MGRQNSVRYSEVVVGSGLTVCQKFNLNIFFWKIKLNHRVSKVLKLGTKNIIGVTLFCFSKSKQIICSLERRFRDETINKSKYIYLKQSGLFLAAF
jgi:hypothetical protein